MAAFSDRSRSRLLRAIAEIDWHRVERGVFATYTYPDGRWDGTMEDRKRHRYVIHRAVEKYVGNPAAAIWRVEWQPRLSGSRIGELAPHLHCLYFGVDYLPHKVLEKAWKSAIGEKNYANVWLERCDEASMAALYVAKYCTKISDCYSLGSVPYRNRKGRHWGWRRKELIPWYPATALAVFDRVDFDWLCGKAAQVLAKVNPELSLGFTLLGKEADKLFEEFCLYRVAKGTEGG